MFEDDFADALVAAFREADNDNAAKHYYGLIKIDGIYDVKKLLAAFEKQFNISLKDES